MIGRKYVILALVEEKGTPMKEISENMGIRIQHLSSYVSDLVLGKYLTKEQAKKKGSRSTKILFLTKKGKEAKQYFLKRKRELNLSWREVGACNNI